tara:strand:- start:257 stop:1360 length:1104 start_codon:yes stop_codon:yes gene_type:complete
MKPEINSLNENDNEITFILSGVDISIANAIRRTILQDIDTVVFKTSPHSENDAVFIKNTSRFNNEQLKQRLSCIPIHIKDFSNIENIELHVNCENTSKDIQYVTTEHFNIFDKSLQKYISSNEREQIFPKNSKTGHYIQFVRLRPKISDDIPGEEIKFTCKFSISNASKDSMFNVACNSSYGFTWDKNKADEMWLIEEEKLENEGYEEDKIEFMRTDWYLLDAKRYYIPNSFNFNIESVGVFTPRELIIKSCEKLKSDFNDFKSTLDDDLELILKESVVNIDNCYDLKLQDKDATFGKSLEYILYSEYFEKGKISFCGYKKLHPHDNFSTIRLAFNEQVNDVYIKDMLIYSCSLLINIFNSIELLFK